MELATGLILLVIFVASVVLLMRGQSPIVVLLALAVLWSLIAGIDLDGLQKSIIQGGGTQYASAVIIIVFGAWFGQVLVQTGIAESVIRTAVELAGDRPILAGMTVTLVTALLFTSMYGVGAAIAVGVIEIPILLSLGIPAELAAPTFTIGIGAGTFVNLVNFGTFKTLFPGILYSGPYLTYYVIGMVVYILAGWLMLNFWMRLRGSRQAASIDLGPSMAMARKRTPPYTYVAVLVPLFFVIVLKWEIIPSFVASIIVALLLTAKGRSFQATINLFNKTFYDAFPDIATIAALWVICGMLIVAGMTPQVSRALTPVFGPVLPHSFLSAALFFGILGGIGNIYRGPFSVIGTGAALLAIIRTANVLPGSLSLRGVAPGADAARQHGSDQLLDALDNWLHQGEPL